MKIGLVLPTMIRNPQATLIPEWARVADEAQFSSVAVFDRIAYDCYEPLVTLAAAAAVTKRVRLMTALIISPLRSNASLLAKQAATIDHFSNGRLTLGLGAGVRQDDFLAGGISYSTRGTAMDNQIATMRGIWEGGDSEDSIDIGPRPVQSGGPEIILGGHTRRAINRAARYADGWIAGSGGLDVFLNGSQLLEDAWRAAGRNKPPRRLAVSYFALGPDAKTIARSYLADYLNFAPSDYSERVIDSTPTDGNSLRDAVHAYASSGCDELLLAPCLADTEQLKLLIQNLDGVLR